MPDRFLDPNCRRLQFSPFGFAGGRICPGSRLAIYEAQVILGTLIKHYNISLDSSQPPIKPIYGLVTTTSDEVLLRFEPR